MSITEGAIKKLDAHIWEREANEHYVEPAWCSARLLQDERFEGCIYDPACGFGTIITEAKKAGYETVASDLVDRGCPDMWRNDQDFLKLGGVPYGDGVKVDNIITNPPFNIAAAFAGHALKIATGKVAIVFPTARLNAAHWLKGTPLRRVWMMTPRPSMPPGHVITAGGKITGGKMDYCWLVWETGYQGEAQIKWLRRDATPSHS